MKIYEELEKERKKLYKRYKNYSYGLFIFILVLIYIVICTVLFNNSYNNSIPKVDENYYEAFVYFVLCLFVVDFFMFFYVIFGRKVLKEKKEFEKKVENQIIENVLVEVFEQKPYYYDSQHVPINLINDADLVKRPKKFEGGNLIIGSYGKINFQVSNITLMEKTSSRSRKHSSIFSSYFKGKWYIYQFPKRFSETIKIVEEKPSFSLQKMKKFETEMIEFNNKFSIYATDEKFFYYLINPLFIEKILKLDNMYHGIIYFCITENMLHIGINDNSDMLKFELSKKPIIFKIWNEVKADISLIKDIINVLGLNELMFTDSF